MDPEAPREGPLGPIVFAAGESGGEPAGVAQHFAAGTNAVYAFFAYDGLEANDRVTAEWFLDGAVLFRQTLALSEVFRGSVPPRGHLWVSISFPQGASPGSYQLDLRLNDDLTESDTFAVDP